MTPQELKNSILQLAIQGKLVEQRPEEGTAEELYKQIQVEKQALIKAGKIKKEKPLPEITEDEIPFEIPESWKWCHPQDLASVVVGATPSTANPLFWSQGTIPWLPSGCCQDCEVLPDDSTVKLISQAAFDSCSTKMMAPDTIMIALTGATAGKVGLLRFEACGNQSIVGISLLPFVLPQFIFYQLMARRREILSDCVGSAQPHISKEYVIKMFFPLPPLAEQKRIVAKIEELLPLIERYEMAWGRLEDFNKRFPVDMQKSILQMAIQGKLVEQRPEEGTGEELYKQIQAEKQTLIKTGELKKTKSSPVITEEVFPYEFPDTWKMCYIDDIAFVTKLAGFEYTEYVAPNLVPSGIPLFKGKNVQNGHVVLEFESFIPESVADELPRSQIRKKCLLTPYVGTIGNIAIFDGSFRAHLGSNVGKIELIGGNVQYVLEEYVLYYLRSVIGYLELSKFKKATAQESISIEAIRNVIIPLPPLAEQKRIVTRLEELLPLCARLK